MALAVASTVFLVLLRSIEASVSRLGDLLDFGQLFKAVSNN